MIPIILTNKQTQIHKHVHPHNKSKNFFSKHRQNPEVRNEREERGGEEGWRSALFGPGKVEISVVWTRWKEENGGVERKREPRVWVLGESDGKEEKKKEKKGFLGRERIHVGRLIEGLSEESSMGPTKQ